MNKLKYIIVDDERLARTEMKLMMGNYPDFLFVGEASNVLEAELLMTKLNPDLILLDIQMPGKSGFELLGSLEKVPEVIFTTAFEQYAVQAFELNALDYLLKPIRQERLDKAIEKIRAKHGTGKVRAHFFIKEGEKIHFIETAAIHLIESIGNYARLHFKEEKVFFKRSLNQLVKTLDPYIFFRINRSMIINISFIEKVEQLPNGRLNLTLKNEEILTVSSRQSALFKSKKML
jgi:two-component system LytT family response regulator